MKLNNLTYGVLISRCQPLHQGHIDVIKKALEENDRVLLLIGSADKSGTERNPFDAEARREMFYALEDYLDTDRINFMCLDDWSDDKDIPYESSVGSTNSDYDSVSKEWGSWLYYSIVNQIRRKDFTLYYNDNPAIINSWFPQHIRNRIKVESMERSEYSSSIIRKKLLECDLDYLKRAIPYYSVAKIRVLINEYKDIKED